MNRPVRRGTRRLVTTVTGSRYAFAQTLDGRWWVRPRAKRARGSTTTLPDTWRPITRPIPWPPRSGDGMLVEFVDVRPVRLTSGRVILMGSAYGLAYSSPQAFCRHRRLVLGTTAGAFRRHWSFPKMLAG